ncbi:MAG TPA: hypothetical protein VHC43_03575 [Mycobacteriales bacterium]|nr:hypothetical protein [Mycobacteriales bacterium]
MRSIRPPGGPTTTLFLAAVVAAGVALPATSAASAPLTKAQARSIAKHVNLRATDFPGYTSHPYQSSKSARATDRQYADCVGLAPAFAKVHSPSYDDGSSAIYSSVTEFVTSRKTAQRDDRRSASANARACLNKELLDIANGVGSTSTQVTVTPVAESPVAGLDAIYADRWSATYTVVGYTGTLHGWVVGFSRGNVEASLDEIGTTEVAESKLQAPFTAVAGRLKQKVAVQGVPVRHS